MNWSELTDFVAENADLEIPVADLEYVGLSRRVIYTLESTYECIYLHQLIELRSEDLYRMKNFDLLGMKSLQKALQSICNLESERNRWNASSKKIELYKKQINMRELLA